MPVNIKRLKAIVYANLALQILYVASITFILIQYLRFGRSFGLPFLLYYLVIGCLLIHTILIIYILSKRYPNKEISSSLKTCITVFAVLSGIIVILLILGVAGLVLSLVNDDTRQADKWSTALGIIWAVLVIVLMSFQIGMGQKLARLIQNNYRHELENSIA
jgi:hypothetical protein